MDQSRTKLAVINLIVLLIAGTVGISIARLTNSFAAFVALSFLGIGFLVTLVGYFQMRLAERERLEKLEFDELTKTPSSSALFIGQEGQTLPARRAREQFDKYFVPGFAILLMLATGAGAFFLWRWLAKPTVVPLQQPMLAMALFGLFGLVLFLLGRYSISISKVESQRLITPSAEYFLLSAYLCFAVSAIIAGAQAGFPLIDLYAAHALTILLGFVAIETLLTLVLEVYRPRLRGTERRLLYDSRLVGLLAQPESLFTTAAHALDYQFGFAVSETRFFQFLQKAFAWIIVGQLAILFLSTMLVVIETGEQALLERFGKPVARRAILDPGVHLKWPWPIDKIGRYRTDQVQTFTVGVAPEDDDAHGNTVLWTVGHYKEEYNLLVASRDTSANTNIDSTKKSPPVNLLSVSIPVQFQITNLTAWAYNNSQPDQLLEKVATREVVRYLVSADLHEIMSTGRGAAAELLRQRIQDAANDRSLGAHIVFAGLQDIHPPVAVAGAYEKVVGAIQAREAKILAAQADAIRTNALASATAFKTLRDAEADRDRTRVVGLARAAAFTNQIPAFRAAPTVYAQRSYHQTLSRVGSTVRKYVIAATNTDDVILFDLQEKIRTDLLDVQIPQPPTKK